jgi:hypothetical protein
MFMAEGIEQALFHYDYFVPGLPPLPDSRLPFPFSKDLHTSKVVLHQGDIVAIILL